MGRKSQKAARIRSRNRSPTGEALPPKFIAPPRTTNPGVDGVNDVRYSNAQVIGRFVDQLNRKRIVSHRRFINLFGGDLANRFLRTGKQTHCAF